MDRPPHDYPAVMPYPQQPYAYPPPPPPPPQQFHGGGGTPPPQYLPPQHQHQHQFQYNHHHAPPPAPAHFHHAQGFSPHLPPPPPPPAAAQFHHAPADPELHKRIDKLVEYSAKNGPEFEAMIREKQKDNPDYSFLFGGDGHVYYRHKLWLSLSARPPYAPFPPPAMPRHAPPLPPMHQPQQPHFYDIAHPQFFPQHQQQQQQQAPGKPFMGLSGPLPGDVVAELAGVLAALNGTKESINGAKFWFVQRSVFAPALAEALRDRVFALDDSDRQLHIIYLANDILFESMHRRTNDELDNEALAFKPVLGSMLARIYHHPHIQEDSQSKLQQLLQLWASNNIYDPETINALRNEMVGGQSAHSFPGPPKELSTGSVDSSAGLTQAPMHSLTQWHPDRQSAIPNLVDQEHPDKLAVPGQTMPPSVFPGSMPIPAAVQPANQQPVPHLLPSQPASIGEKAPPYPLFPPGLIPGMVRKMQIGSGVPYSPMSPLDIPTIIPPSNVSQSEILERVSKFFKEIGEVNPSEGQLKSDDRDDGDEYDKEYDREPAVRKGGACIPPPANLQADPESGTYADGTVERKPGFSSSGRLGLGATANPNEISQYDDVYTSYRKQRSTNYHSSMSTRATAR